MIMCVLITDKHDVTNLDNRVAENELKVAIKRYLKEFYAT